MKTKKILLIVLLSFAFISCKDDNEGKPEMTSSIIEVKAQPIATQNSSEVAPKSTQQKVVFTENDIVSYNAKTGEIIFKSVNSEETPLDILKRFSEKLDFYMDGKVIFSLKSRIVSDIESRIYNEPILHYTNTEGSKFYIQDGYPWGIPIDDNTTNRTGQGATVDKERKENVDKIISGWLLFTDRLKKANKYIEK